MRLAAILSAFICIYAGFYLLSLQAPQEGNGLVALAHGIGGYCIGKGIYVGAALWQAAGPAKPIAPMVDH